MSKDYRSRVFHVAEFGKNYPEPAVYPDDYILVAIVDSEVLEKVFELTNHIDTQWWDNDGVEVVGDNHHRSTSVGDIVVTNEGTFRCEDLGWHELETVVR
jgi:hypothetical protein